MNCVRAVAIFLVVLLHVSAAGFYMRGPQWNAANFYDSASRVSVPLFFLLSGALLVPRNESILRWISRMARLALIYVAASIVYLLWRRYLHGQNVDWMSALVNGNAYVHLWFLRSLLLCYLLLPILGSISKAEQGYVWPLLGLWFIFPGALGDFAYAGYLLLGAQLMKMEPRRWHVLLYVAGTAFTVIELYETRSEFFYEYLSQNVILASAGAFMFLRTLKANPNLLARASLGIYLLHPMVLELLPLNYASFNAWLSIPFAAIVITVITSAILLPFGMLTAPVRSA